MVLPLNRCPARPFARNQLFDRATGCWVDKLTECGELALVAPVLDADADAVAVDVVVAGVAPAVAVPVVLVLVCRNRTVVDVVPNPVVVIVIVTDIAETVAFFM